MTLPFPRRSERPAASTASVDLGLLAASLIWGLNFPVMKAALAVMDPLAFNALRFPLAALFMLVLLRASGRRMLPPRSEWRRLALLALLGHIAFQLCFIYGLNATRTGNAALLLATSPAWVVAISAALGRERFSAGVLAGMLAALAGMVLLVAGGGEDVGGAGAGDLLVLGAALSWSAFTVFARRITRRHGAAEVSAWTLWVALPAIVLAGVPGLARTDWSAVPAAAWLWCAYAGAGAIGVAYVMWSRGVRTLGESRTAAYQNLVPVTALTVAWAWLGEVPTGAQAAGAVVILSGVALARGLLR